MTGVRMLQPTEFLRAAGEDPAAFKLQLPVQQQATYLLPAYEDGASRNNWEEGVRGGFWLEAADAAAASAAAFQASTQSSARAVVSSSVVGNKYCYTEIFTEGQKVRAKYQQKVLENPPARYPVPSLNLVLVCFVLVCIYLKYFSNWWRWAADLR